MSGKTWLRRSAAALCAGGLLHACMAAPQPAVSPAFLIAAPQDMNAVQAMAREQRRHAQTCSATRSCDRVHYLQALVALYKDRADAEKHFQAVVADAPNGRYAASSLHWLRLLKEGPRESDHEPTLIRTVERLVREVLEYETEDAQIAQLLKQQLKAQEKKIEELTEQIDALKRVDQEVKEQVKPSRPAH